MAVAAAGGAALCWQVNGCTPVQLAPGGSRNRHRGPAESAKQPSSVASGASSNSATATYPARFPARKSLEESGFDHARGLKRDTIAHLGTLDFITAKENVIFLGPPVIHGT
jgi:DNA replication protein DnaC